MHKHVKPIVAAAFELADDVVLVHEHVKAIVDVAFELADDVDLVHKHGPVSAGAGAEVLEGDEKALASLAPVECAGVVPGGTRWTDVPGWWCWR